MSLITEKYREKECLLSFYNVLYKCTKKFTDELCTIRPKKHFFCNAWSRLEGVVILCDKIRTCMKHSENFFRKQNSSYLPC